MADKVQITEIRVPSDGGPPPTVVPPKRSPGHRGADVRDTVAEMAAKAQEISQEAGSKMAAAMKDVISAAAGLSGFAIESARDLVQYMVRRGQMTQEEADKLIREAEVADAKRNPHPVPPPSRVPKPPPVERTEVLVSGPSVTPARGVAMAPAIAPVMAQRADVAPSPTTTVGARPDKGRPMPGKADGVRAAPVIAKKAAPPGPAKASKKKAAVAAKAKPHAKVAAKKKTPAKR